jgi:hypothetical protein
MRALLRLATVDLTPLRHRDFRYLFWGQMVSMTGMTRYIALYLRHQQRSVDRWWSG